MVVALIALPAGRAQTVLHLPIYRNPSYSPAERAVDLVARMTLAEKASQMVSGQSPAIPRLGVKAYGWWNESLHGVSRLQLNPGGTTTTLFNTTSYPSDLALGSTWDPALMYREATAISDEAREIVPDNAYDLDFFAPTVNLSRDPRWGRNDETFSEDPLLTANIAAQYVNGMEGKDERGHLLTAGGGYLKTIATLKHYAANNSEVNRLTGSSNMDERTLREYYTAQFRLITAQTQPGAMMSAFNAVNGIPSVANPHLIGTLARQTFGFGGYFTSDCDAIDGIVSYHKWRPPGYSRPLNRTEAHAFAKAAGVDLNCTSADDLLTDRNLLPAAVGEGIRTTTDTFNVGDLDTSLVRLFTARMQLGEFGAIDGEPWVRAARARRQRGTWVNSDANHAVTETSARLGLARGVADRTLVLLKNAVTTRRDGSAGKLLPITVPRSGPFRVAVIGALANQPNMYLGGYASLQGPTGQANEVTPYAGIKRAIQTIDPSATVDFYNGFTGGSNAAELTNIDPAAVAAAANYDDVIVYAGTDRSTAGEYQDRGTLALPGAQAQLINDVAAVNRNTIAVMGTVGEVDLASFQSQVPAMVWSAYDGERAGDALADVLLGAYDPSGHLPFTWYASEQQLAPITDYRIRPAAGNPGRTYMYYRGPIAYPFGYGLSYTTFRSSHLHVSRARADPDTVDVTLDATNTGTVSGEDLIQLYVTSPGAGDGQQPIKRLEGFRQVFLLPGQTKALTLTLKIADLGAFNSALGHFVVPEGRYGVQIAASALDSDIELGSYVQVSRPPQPMLGALSAQPAMPGDAARGIQRRVMFPQGTTVLPRLTLSMNDQSLYGYLSPGHTRPLPTGAVVRLRSNHPTVVSVQSDGSLHTLDNGVATITATISRNGVSRSTQFVVRVLSELTGLSVAGQPLPNFAADTYDYDVLVPAGMARPRISARPPSGQVRMQVTQAVGVPGTGTVRVTGPDGIGFSYRVNFARPARSDTFSASTIGSQWTWLRHDPSSEHASGGALTILAQPGDLASHTARNLLLQPALGDWTMQTRVHFSSAPHAATQQGGLIAYADDENYLKLDLEYGSGGTQLSETSADSLSGTPIAQVAATVATPPSATTVWLRMVKRGPRYSTYYSFDGSHFAELYNTGASLTDVAVGPFAFAGSDPTTDLLVSFGAFYITNTGTTVTLPRPPGKRKRPRTTYRKSYPASLAHSLSPGPTRNAPGGSDACSRARAGGLRRLASGDVGAAGPSGAGVDLRSRSATACRSGPDPGSPATPGR